MMGGHILTEDGSFLDTEDSARLVTEDFVPDIVTQSDGGGGGRAFPDRGSARIRHREIDAAVDRALEIIASRNAKLEEPVPATPKRVQAVIQQEEPAAPRFTLEAIDAALARVLAESEDDEEAAWVLLAA